jgi:hypothetical protein
MRVMMAVVMQSQHELLRVSDGRSNVNPENSMHPIGIANGPPIERFPPGFSQARPDAKMLIHQKTKQEK